MGATTPSSRDVRREEGESGRNKMDVPKVAVTTRDSGAWPRRGMPQAETSLPTTRSRAPSRARPIRLARRPGKTYSSWATRDAKYVRRYIRLYRSIYGVLAVVDLPVVVRDVVNSQRKAAA